MIILTLGTINTPFYRAVDWLQSLLENKLINEPVLFQYGTTPVNNLKHPLVTNVKSLKRYEMQQYINKASLVISHAGQGSTRMLAEMGARFILIPRLKRHGEHIDDHQLIFARQVEKFGIHYCTEYHQLVRLIKQRPLPYYGQLFDAPLLVEYLIDHYQGLESRTYTKANR
ncbi:glucosyl transferase [Aphanothece hegewaldii CCALA 016]|uniref:Glucosyl transferase n=1 Tax=Aphanothece hegewaldii CCALA 016 TaxID=2107694 RepID=A0A2T1M1S7_9CHRO|nr:glycosyltransferase [Aphanothece hegewaldii]PSF38669.1 glucosyl transferase [Aphanothece hegewaldii CCALA 016]